MINIQYLCLILVQYTFGTNTNSKLVVLATNHIFSVICLKLRLRTWLCYYWLHGIIQKCRLIYHHYYFYTFFWNYSYCCYHNHWWIKFFICFFDRLICLEARRRIELMLPCSRKSLKLWTMYCLQSKSNNC